MSCPKQDFWQNMKNKAAAKIIENDNSSAAFLFYQIQRFILEHIYKNLMGEKKMIEVKNVTKEFKKVIKEPGIK